MSSSTQHSTTENVIVVGLVLPNAPRTVAEEHLDELAALVEASAGTVVGRVMQERHSPDTATYIGSGKAEEVERMVKELSVQLVVFDDDLTPAQVKNLEKVIHVKVIDRSALILDIFARRARTREAQTQVELAQLNYLLPRLTRHWTHLSRQAGGIGTRGVGETQLELDRRMIRTRISRLKDDLQKIEKTRATQRKGRYDVFTVALVGYTNAGKSTLFNLLTNGSAEAVDKVFATLDAKMQKMSFPMPTDTVVIDTVGFIRKLPHHLVASFRSTMEEALSADLVLHVINMAHPQAEEQRQVGSEVLDELQVPKERIIEVFNKADQVEGSLYRERGRSCVTVSALTGKGTENLLEMIRQFERSRGQVVHLSIPMSESKLISMLHHLAEVQEQSATDEQMRFTAWVPKDHLHHFAQFETPAMRHSTPA